MIELRLERTASQTMMHLQTSSAILLSQSCWAGPRPAEESQLAEINRWQPGLLVERTEDLYTEYDC